MTGRKLLDRYAVGARDFVGANLGGTDLRGANLRGANLGGTDLRGATLGGTDLRGAGLRGADLADTCLAGIPGVTPAALEWHGWEVRDGWVYGWRTRRSQHCGGAQYRPGSYEAPWLSVDEHTDCHPGIYMLPTQEAAATLSPQMVRCRARCEDVILLRNAEKGLRTRRLEVLR